MGWFGASLIMKSGIPRKGLAAEYLANNNFLDTSGNNYTGINIGGNVTFGNDRKGNPNSAFVLNGSDACININASLAGLSTTTKGTWNSWVKPVDATPAANQFINAFGDKNAGAIIQMLIDTSGKLRAAVVLGGVVQWDTISNNVVFADGVWGNPGLVMNGVSPTLYFNGNLLASTFLTDTDKTIWFNNIAGIDNGRIGCRNFLSLGDIQLLEGSIDDNRIYNRNLSSSEMKAIFNG